MIDIKSVTTDMLLEKLMDPDAEKASILGVLLMTHVVRQAGQVEELYDALLNKDPASVALSLRKSQVSALDQLGKLMMLLSEIGSPSVCVRIMVDAVEEDHPAIHAALKQSIAEGVI